MKRQVVVGWFLAAAGWIGLSMAPTAADDVKVGDPVERVRSELGEPAGYIRMEAWEMFIYDRGKVEVRDGFVSQVHLVSPDTLEARRQAEMARREHLVTEGVAVRQRAIDDPSQTGVTDAEQVAYWQSFQRRYPGVNPPPAFALAQARLRERQAEEREAAARAERDARLQLELARLQDRVDAAEQRAHRAEDAARDARDDARFSRTAVYLPAPIYSYSVIPAVAPCAPVIPPCRPAVSPKRPPVLDPAACRAAPPESFGPVITPPSYPRRRYECGTPPPPFNSVYYGSRERSSSLEMQVGF